MSQEQLQLTLPDGEMRQLGARVDSDYRSAIGDHNTRKQRFSDYQRRWLARAEANGIAREDESNYPVPLIEWLVSAKLAKEADALFGDDAQIVAVPIGPSDYRKVEKIGRYMTWRVFDSMKLTNPFLEFVLRKILNGRSHAYAPWETTKYNIVDPKTGKDKEITEYDGPGFFPLDADDFIVPAQDARTLHDFDWVMRRVRVTPEDLLAGEERGIYQGIEKNFEKILRAADNRQQREYEGEEVKLEQDDAEGVTKNQAMTAKHSLMLLEWYGRWRMLKNQSADQGTVDELDIKKRQLRPTDIVVRYLYDTKQVVGIQDLRKIYPTLKDPRPFVESAMTKDGSYWCKGYGQMLIDSEDEIRANHNQGTNALDMAVGPVIFYKPSSGLTPDNIKLEAKMAIPCDNPGSDVKVIEFAVNMEPYTVKENAVLAYVERLTGMSDNALGRQIDRPNAPRTARGTEAILQQGSDRLNLDNTILREDMRAILRHFWELEFAFSDSETFFRVTEEDADGLFPVKDGGAILTQEDRDGRYDFRLQFATSDYSKSVDKQNALARYQIDIQNPLIAQNPAALWSITNDVHKALGDGNFEGMVPRPPDQDLPIDPKEEWTRCEQGEEIHVNPMDNDQLHILRHKQDLDAALAEIREKGDGVIDRNIVKKMAIHFAQQMEQLKHKRYMQAAMELSVQKAQQEQQNPGMPPQFAAAQGVPGPLQGGGVPPIPPVEAPGQLTPQRPNISPIQAGGTL